MRVLLIDTTTSFVTVSIVDNGKVLYNFFGEIREDMSSKIIPIIDEGLSSLSLELSDMDKIMVCNGPGSFTGIRIGVTIAKTISWALNIDVIPISSLELIATTPTKKRHIVPLIDARRGNVFSGIYDTNLNQIKNDQLVSLQSLLSELNDDYELVSYDDIGNTIKPCIDVLKIVDKHKNDKSINPHNLNPNYLKLTEAEENRIGNDND